jgi:hypothetical protein
MKKFENGKERFVRNPGVSFLNGRSAFFSSGPAVNLPSSILKKNIRFAEDVSTFLEHQHRQDRQVTDGQVSRVRFVSGGDDPEFIGTGSTSSVEEEEEEEEEERGGRERGRGRDGERGRGREDGGERVRRDQAARRTRRKRSDDTGSALSANSASNTVESCSLSPSVAPSSSSQSFSSANSPSRGRFVASLSFVTDVKGSTKNKLRRYTFVSDHQNMNPQTHAELIEMFLRKHRNLNFQFVVPSSTTRGMYIATVGRDNICSCKGWTFSRYPRKTCVHLKDIYHTIGNRGLTVPSSSSFQIAEPVRFSCVGRSVPLQAFDAERQQFHGRFKIRTKLDGIRVVVFPNGMVFTRNLFLYEVSRYVASVFQKEIQERRLPAMDCELYINDVTRSTHDMVMNEVINRAEGHIHLPSVSLAVLDLYVPAYRKEATSVGEFQAQPVLELAAAAMKCRSKNAMQLLSMFRDEEKQSEKQFQPQPGEEDGVETRVLTRSPEPSCSSVSSSSSSSQRSFESKRSQDSPSRTDRPRVPFSEMSFQQRFRVLAKFFRPKTDRGRSRNTGSRKRLLLHLHDGMEEKEISCSQLTTQQLIVSFLKRMAALQEGIVVQNMDYPYLAGRRDVVSSFKIKREEDLLELKR